MKSDSIAPNASETVVVQLADGRVMLNARSHTPDHRRAISISLDGVTGWSEPHLDSGLLESVCMGSIVRHSLPSGDRPGRILFANPRNLEKVGKSNRRNLTIHLSEDEGQTWRVHKTIEPGNSAYSDLAVLPDGTVLCLYERGGENAPDPKVHDHYAYLTLARFDLQWLKQTPSPQ
jgi:sialidase-1